MRYYTLSDLEPLRVLLRQFKYRPGWEFRLDEEGAVCVEATVVDANNQGSTCPLLFRKFAPRSTHPGFPWERWLFEAVIMAVERHEAQEFFEVAGARIYDPHVND